MPTQTPQIQRIESLDDLALLMPGDIVEIERRKYLMRVHYNRKRDKILNIFGRGDGECIQWIALDYSEIRFNSGKLILIKPRSIDSFFRDNLNHRDCYDFSKKRLEEAGIWEKQ